MHDQPRSTVGDKRMHQNIDIGKRTGEWWAYRQPKYLGLLRDRFTHCLLDPPVRICREPKTF